MAKIANLVEIVKTSLRRIRNAPAASYVSQVEDIGGAENEMEIYGLPGVFGRPTPGTKGVKIDLGGMQIIVATHNYDLQQALVDGETYIYAMDADGTVLGSLYLNKDSEVVVNGGTDYAVSWTDLNTAMQALVTALNAALGTKMDTPGTPGTLSLDLSSAKVNKVRLP